jgi:hypothetical protein
MKIAPSVLDTQDRIATWDEVRQATMASPDRVMEFMYTAGSHCEVDSESGDTVRYRADEFEFFAYLSEMNDNEIN